METSRAPHLTREISRGFLETGKVEKVAQRICSEHTEGVLVLSETMGIRHHICTCACLLLAPLSKWFGNAQGGEEMPETSRFETGNG